MLTTRFVKKVSQVTLIATIAMGGSHTLNAADPSQPHPHNGILQPFSEPPPKIRLTRAEKVKLSQNEPIFKHVETEGGGHGVAVFRVGASEVRIWDVISNFKKYTDWVDGVAESKVYKKAGDFIYVEMKQGKWYTGYYTSYFKHNFPMEKKGWGTWRLDYRRTSDLDDVVGYWRVDPVPGRQNLCDVTYSVRAVSSLPNWLMNMIQKDGIKKATQWVKREAEAD